MSNVSFNTKSVLSLTKQDLVSLKSTAQTHETKRARLCLHRTIDDPVHEMIIAVHQSVYIRPHKHINKAESFHIIEGELYLFLFNDEGSIDQKFLLNTNENFLVKIDKNIYHCIVPMTETIVIHETTNGPYLKENNSVFAPWAPLETDEKNIQSFKKKLLES